MPSREPVTSIPPAWVVRVVAVVTLALGVSLCVVSVVNYRTLGWWALLGVVSGLWTAFFSLIALKTGRPEWLLLDLIVPS